MKIKKPKISKRSIIIAAILILLLGIPTAYLVSIRNQEESGAWYNSSWLYRRSISVGNPGSTLTNEDVLIEVDTATLVTASKLQADCDDLRFIDSDDSTPLAYWVEGGCNTSTTHIWVQIPTLNSGGETIYMYYGNTSATNSEQTWTGKFYLMKNSACDSGWTTESNSGGDFYQKFPKPSSSYGTTGGSTTHNHGNYNLTTSVVSSGANTNTSGTNNISIGHSHNFTLVTEDNTSVLPPYLDMIFCSNNDLVLKQYTIAEFTSTVSASFTRFSALDTLLPRGNSTYGGTSTATTHTHNTTTVTSGVPSATGTNATGAVNIPSSTHTHNAAASATTAGSQVPPTLTTIFGQANNDLMAPTGTIVMSNATPPLGWTRFSSLDGYYPTGGSTYGNAGGVSSHTHNLPALSFTATSDYVLGGTANPKLSLPSATHTHSTSQSATTSVNNEPPYISTLFIQKKTSQTVTVNNEEVDNQAPNQPSDLYTEGAPNPTGVIDLTPEFSAVFSDPDTANTGTYYEIEVNTNNTFTGTVMWDTTQTATGPITNGARSSDFSYAGTALTENGVTYYWRIRFWDNNGAVSNWSTTANFTMNTSNVAPDAPSVPYAEGVTNPATVTDLTPEFSAVFTDSNAPDTGAYYEIEVNTNNTFTGTVMWDTTQTATGPITNGARSSDFSYAGTALTRDGTTYYWRIKFWDNNGAVSNWSATQQFTMDTNVAPNAPTSPLAETATNPVKVSDITPEFSAIFTDNNATDTGTYYEIEVNTNNTFTGTVMWDTGQTATGPITNNTRSSDYIYAGTALTLDGVTYYWRIRFWDDSTTVSDWSTTQQFTMTGIPNNPTSLLTEGATDPTGVTDTTPEFSAIYSDPNADNGTSYEIEVNTNNTFTGTVMWDSGQVATGPITSGNRSTDISYAGTTLTKNSTTYYWRIRFWDIDGVSGWSSTAQFTMGTNTIPNAPSTPYAEGATNPIKVGDITPEFSAVFSDTDAGDTGAYYEIEVNTNNTFTGTVMWDTGQTATSIANGVRSPDYIYAGTALTLDGVTYYWRIRFWDIDGGVSNWSTTQQFTMSGIPNNPTSLLTEGATDPTGVTDTTPEFSAIYSDPNADNGTSYEIEVNTNNTFTGTVMWDTAQTATGPITNNTRSSDFSYAGTALTRDGTTYYWRIRFWDIDGVSGWSSTAQFTMATNTAPNAPSSPLTETATNPDNVVDITPEFSAIFSDSNAIDVAPYYEIEVNTNDTFTGTVMWDSNKTSITPITNGARSSDIPYAGTALTFNGTIYYWRIRFWDDTDAVSNWSTTAQFKMSGAPNAPTSLLTEGEAIPTWVTDYTPEFSAIYSDTNTGDTAVYYEVDVNTNNTFTGTVMWASAKTAIAAIANGARSTDITYAGSTLTKNGATYYWRIRFWDAADNVSDWSSTSQFTMADNLAPNAPTLMYTEGVNNPSGVTDLTPEFSAVFSDTDVDDIGAYYSIDVNTASDFTGTILWSSGTTALSPTVANGARSTDISYAGSALTRNGTTYYWRIKFGDGSGAMSPWSATRQFTMATNDTPNAPSALYTEGTTDPIKVLDLTPEFSAIFSDPNGSDTGVYYEIHVNTAPDFSGTVMWASTQTAISAITNGARSTDISYAGSVLTNNGALYYWRIRFWDDGGGVSSWSTTAQFRMPGAPNAPTNQTVDGISNPVEILSTTPTFAATHTDNNGDSATHYEVEVNSNSLFTGTVMWDTGQQIMTSTPNNQTIPGIVYAGTALTGTSSTIYYWRIRLWDSDGNVGTWSTIGSFVDYIETNEWVRMEGLKLEGLSIN